MRFLKNKYIFHASIILAVIALDQLSKYLALRFLASSAGSFLGLSLQEPIKNYHLIFGLRFISDSLFINTALTAVFCLFLFYYALSLVFIPQSLFHLKIGISLLFAGFSSNVINKLINGYVPDFIKWSFSQTASVYFNVADMAQTLAWAVIALQLFFLRKHIWRERERRRRLIIARAPQLQFVGYSALAFLAVSAFFLILNYQFLGLIDVMDFANIKQISASFLKYSVFILILFGLCLGSFFVYLSNKIYGPVYAFERYVKALIQGKNPKDLRLRKNDQFKQLESLAKEIKNSIKPG